MTPYEYEEQIKVLEGQLADVKVQASKIAELIQASHYLVDQELKAYRAAFDELYWKADVELAISVMENLNKKLLYINAQYGEHIVQD